MGFAVPWEFNKYDWQSANASKETISMRRNGLVKALVLVCGVTLFSACSDKSGGGVEMHGDAAQSALDGLARYRELERESFGSANPAIFDRFSKDMTLMSAGSPTLRGREAIRKHFEAVWKTHRTRFVEVVDEEVYQAGDVLIAVGRFTLAVSEVGSNDEALSNGRYVAVFKPREDGEFELWKEVVTDGGPDTDP